MTCLSRRLASRLGRFWLKDCVWAGSRLSRVMPKTLHEYRDWISFLLDFVDGMTLICEFGRTILWPSIPKFDVAIS